MTEIRDTELTTYITSTRDKGVNCFSRRSHLLILADGEKPARCLPSLARALALLLALRSGTYVLGCLLFLFDKSLCVCVCCLFGHPVATNTFFLLHSSIFKVISCARTCLGIFSMYLNHGSPK